MAENSFQFVDVAGFDPDYMEFLESTHDPCEVALQWIQRLIVEVNGKDVIKIAPPILSRVYNQLGNGIVKLNNARKIKEFPIPFPLAQMITIMQLVNVLVTSVVCALEVDSPYFAFLFAFVITLSF